MAVSIKNEANYRANRYTNFENLRLRYLEEEVNTQIAIKYPSPSLEIIDNELFKLLNNSTRVNWNIRWNYKPDYLSYDYYGTIMYWPLILYVNNIPSIEDFYGLETVMIPRASAINKLLRNRIDPRDIITVARGTDINEYSKYYKKYPLDENELERIKAKENLIEDTSSDSTTETVLEEVSEEFTLTSTNITNEYVLLEKVPVNASAIVFTIENYVESQKYAYDYILLKDDNGDYKKIAWDEDSCIGSGMSSILDEAGITFTIVYVTQETT